MAKFKPSLTTAGLRVLSEGLGGKEIKFTSIAIGDGEYSGSTSAITKLVSEKARAAISSVDVKSGEAKVRASIVYADLPVEFKWRELGVFVTDPDTQQEVLYAYANAGSNYDTIGGDQALTEMNVLVKVLVGEAANVTVNVQSGENIYAKKEDLDKIQTNVTNITNIIQQVTGVDPSNPDAEPPSGSMVVTLMHTKSDTVHAFTGLGERTGLVPCQFKSTAGYTEGDTATIDGTAYTITLTGADAPETDLFVSGKSILIDVDTEGKFINFKSGGGLTNGKLALADATEDTVFNGRTFYAGSKTMRTGRALATATNVTAQKMFAGVTAYNQQGQLITGNPAATNVTAAKMFTGTTAFDRNGNLITGAPTKTNVQASDIARGKKAYTDAGALLTGTGLTVLAGSIQPTIEYRTYNIYYPSGVSGKPRVILAYFNVWIGDYATSGQQPSFSPYFFRGAVSGQLNGITTAESGTMRNQNQSSANTTIDVGTTSFSVNFNKYDYISGSEFCYICIW